MSALQWMVMRVRPVHRLEFEVLHALTQKDHPAMVPFEIKWERRPGIKHLRPKKYPLLPCYVFAAFSHVQEFVAAKAYINDLAEAKGKRPPIVGLIGYGSTPAILSPTDVSFLKGLSTPEPATVAIHKALQAGQQATIIAGPFQGQTVKIDSVTRKECKVFLKVLDGYHSVKINPASLVAA